MLVGKAGMMVVVDDSDEENEVPATQVDEATEELMRARTMRLEEAGTAEPANTGRPILTEAERQEIMTWPDSQPQESPSPMQPDWALREADDLAAGIPKAKATVMTAVKAPPPGKALPEAAPPSKAAPMSSVADMCEMRQRCAELEAQLAMMKSTMEAQEATKRAPCESPLNQRPMFTPPAQPPTKQISMTKVPPLPSQAPAAPCALNAGAPSNPLEPAQSKHPQALGSTPAPLIPAAKAGSKSPASSLSPAPSTAPSCAAKLEEAVPEDEEALADEFDLSHQDFSSDCCLLFAMLLALTLQVACHVFMTCDCDVMQELTPHALYMRLKRLCAKTNTGKLQVPENVHQQWLTGSRDELSLAMTRALKMHGFDSSHKTRQLVRVGTPGCARCFCSIMLFFLVVTLHQCCFVAQAEFTEQLVKIHELTASREEEVEGAWYTEERMEKDLKYSRILVCASSAVLIFCYRNGFSPVYKPSPLLA